MLNLLFPALKCDVRVETDDIRTGQWIMLTKLTM
jgi:hypothetical protein